MRRRRRRELGFEGVNGGFGEENGEGLGEVLT